MNQIDTPIVSRNGLNFLYSNNDQTPMLSEFVPAPNKDAVLTARQRELGDRLIDLTAPGSGESVTVSAGKAQVILFRFSATDANIIGHNNVLTIELANGGNVKIVDLDPTTTTLLWAQTGAEIPATLFFTESELDEGVRFARFDPRQGLDGLAAIGGLAPTALFFAGLDNGNGATRKLIDEANDNAPGLPSLFTPNPDVVNFANVIKGTYLDGTQYNALSGNDTVVLADTALIAAQAGYDLLHAFHGNEGKDTITGGSLDDKIFGDEGDDTLHGVDGDDKLDGGIGDDKIYGENHNDTLYGNDGDDEIHGGLGIDKIYGDAGTDNIYGDAGDDILNGGAENDFIYGGAGQDNIRGDEGDDYLAGHNDNDDILGGEGNDYILGGAGDDILHGENGKDELHGGDGVDFMSGGDGIDRLFADDGDDIVVFGGDGGDEIYGGGGNDFIQGNEGNDWLDGGEDNDTAIGGNGEDALFGRDGDDTLYGNSGDDYIDGDAGKDSIEGGDGNDYLFGGHGDDVLNGGKGRDELLGSIGADIFRFDAGDGGDINAADILLDFEKNVDKIYLLVQKFDFNDIKFEDVIAGTYIIWNNEYLAFVNNMKSNDFSNADFV